MNPMSFGQMADEYFDPLSLTEIRNPGLQDKPSHILGKEVKDHEFQPKFSSQI